MTYLTEVPGCLTKIFTHRHWQPVNIELYIIYQLHEYASDCVNNILYFINKVEKTQPVIRANEIVIEKYELIKAVASIKISDQPNVTARSTNQVRVPVCLHHYKNIYF